MTARRLEIPLVLPLVLLLVLVLPSLLVAGAAAFGAATTSVRSRPPSALALAGRATHYDVLGASRGASAAVLKERYRALARRTHPDAAPARAGGEAAYDFHDVSSAWRVLGDERERRRYDRSRGGDRRRAGGGGPHSAGGGLPGRGGRARRPQRPRQGLPPRLRGVLPRPSPRRALSGGAPEVSEGGEGPRRAKQKGHAAPHRAAGRSVGCRRVGPPLRHRSLVHPLYS